MRIARAWAASIALCWPLGCDTQGDPSAATSTASHVVISPAIVSNANAPIPSNGGLLISGPVSDPPRVTVTSSDVPDAPPIEGSVHSLFHYEVWVGDEPLPPGTYSVTIDSDPFGSGASTIQIVEPRTPARPALESDATLVITRDVPIFDCCWTLADRVPSLLSCFTVRTEDQATLSVTLSSSEPASVLSQLLFRITAEGAVSANPMPFTEVYGSLVFPAQADAYCYEVEAFEITTGESYLFNGPELCVPHGAQAALETHAVDSVVESQLDRAVCPAPPASHQDAWCALNLAACEAEDEGTAACSLAGHVCRGEPRPAGMVYDPSGGTTDYAGAGGASGAAAGGASGMNAGGASGMNTSGGASGAADEPGGNGGDDGSEQPETTERASNCSCSVVRAHPSEPGAQLAALGALAVLAARRARRRASGPSV